MSFYMLKFYAPEELAQILNVGVTLISNLVSSGQLRAYRIGDHVRVGEADLQAYLERAVVNATQADYPPQKTAFPAAAETRKECPTFGGQSSFIYTGSVTTGTTIWPSKKQTYKLQFDATQWALLLATFQGKEIRAGLNFAKPEPASLGEWIKQHWNTKMGPAAYVGGILITEGYAARPRPGWIRIFAQEQTQVSDS
ncbi:MAG: helix-turn-helix domain-containing protein [Acidobacteriota bacterium]